MKISKYIIYLISFILLTASIFLIYTIIKPSELKTNDKDIVKEINRTNTSPTPSPKTKKNTTPTPKIKPPQTATKPTPTPDPNTYACDPGGNCNNYQNPQAAGCPIFFNSDNCDNRCSDTSTHCRQ
ncbi:hypothetical protein ACFL1M_01975 [Patescibacteria group bacterium]